MPRSGCDETLPPPKIVKPYRLKGDWGGGEDHSFFCRGAEATRRCPPQKIIRFRAASGGPIYNTKLDKNTTQDTITIQDTIAIQDTITTKGINTFIYYYCTTTHTSIFWDYNSLNLLLLHNTKYLNFLGL